MRQETVVVVSPVAWPVIAILAVYVKHSSLITHPFVCHVVSMSNKPNRRISFLSASLTSQATYPLIVILIAHSAKRGWLSSISSVSHNPDLALSQENESIFVRARAYSLRRAGNRNADRIAELLGLAVLEPDDVVTEASHAAAGTAGSDDAELEIGIVGIVEAADEGATVAGLCAFRREVQADRQGC